MNFDYWAKDSTPSWHFDVPNIFFFLSFNHPVIGFSLLNYLSYLKIHFSKRYESIHVIVFYIYIWYKSFNLYRKISSKRKFDRIKIIYTWKLDGCLDSMLSLEFERNSGRQGITCIDGDTRDPWDVIRECLQTSKKPEILWILRRV